jgi:hypothetical protein
MTSGTSAEETNSDVHPCTMRPARICSIKPHAEAEAKGQTFFTVSDRSPFDMSIWE